MNKRISSRAIVTYQNKLVVLFRRKKLKDGTYIEYYSLPGGGLEDNETLEENIIREVKEELTLDIKINKYLGVIEDSKSIQHFFYASIIKGIPTLSGEELDRKNNDNYYEVALLDIDNLENTDIYYKDIILDALGINEKDKFGKVYNEVKRF